MKPIRTQGFSLIELLVVIAIIMILTLVAMPTFSTWVQNSRTRAVAESLQNAVRFAQGEAARLSRLVTLTTTSNSWSVSYVAVASGNDQLATLLQQSPAGNLDGVTITPGATSATVLEFNDLGRVFSSATSTGFVALAADATFTIANPNGPRTLKVFVSPSGKVRMCDPDKTLSDTNPDGCPAT